MKMKLQTLGQIFGMLLTSTFGFPSLIENAPYCIYWKNQEIKRPLSKKGTIQLVPGDSIVFQFGKWTDANKTEYESHYLVEIDSSRTSFSNDTSGKGIQSVYYSMTSYGGSAAKELQRVKIKGIKATDSTWVINEWFTPQYESMFGLMPYKLRKKDKREKEGFKRLCREIVNP